MILEELGGNPPDVTLDHIVKDLLSFFNGFEFLHEAKRMIEKKCAIKKGPEHKCWSEDYIKRAWEETIKEDIKSSRRRHWAGVIILQVVKSFVCDSCKQNAAQKYCHATPDEQGCETTPNSEDRTSQSKAELETVGSAGGVEQHSEARLKVSKLTEESGAASGSQLLAFSTYEASSPAEVNSGSSETKNAALVNENEDTTVLLVNNHGQRRNADNYELCSVVDVLDKENVILKNGILSAVQDNTDCGKAKSINGSSKDRSAQRSAKPNTVESVGSVKRRSGENVSAASESEEASKKHKAYDTTYIRIPLTKLFGNKSPSVPPKAGTKLNSKYKLIDGPPFTKKTDDNKIKNKQFYVMSYNNEKNNAEWVYEIMNMNTSPCYKTPQFQDSDSDTDTDTDDPSYQAPNSSNPFSNTDYDRGHLAAAANHMWCQEAYEDTYWMRNITPQNKNLNRGCWKALEKYCRDVVKDGDVRNVHVYTGPLYLRIEGEETVHVLNSSEVMYEEKKAVPTHYFKVLIVEKKNGRVEEPQCFLIANEDRQTEKEMDIKSIESISGLKFTEDIPEMAEVDHTRTATWEGNKGGKSVTIDVRISSFKKNDVEPHSLNEE